MVRVCMGRICYGPSLSWAEFVMGRVVQLPIPVVHSGNYVRFIHIFWYRVVPCGAVG